MNWEAHKQLIELYLSSGGDAKKIKLYESFSMANYAKLKYFVKQLKVEIPETTNLTALPTKLSAPVENLSAPVERKGIWNDLISHYPVELHQSYKDRYKHWLECCSLKVLLNEVPRNDEKTAYELQEKLLNEFEKLDKCQKALKYYQENKRILETKSKADFSGLSNMEILLKRNSTRSNITKRKATIKNMEKALPPETDKFYRKKLHSLNLKREQLQQIENELEILEEMVKE